MSIQNGSIAVFFYRFKSIIQVSKCDIDNTKISCVCAKLTMRFELSEFFIDRIYSFKIKTLLKCNWQWNIARHFTKVLDRTRRCVVVGTFPFFTILNKIFEAWRLQVNICRTNNWFVDAILTLNIKLILLFSLISSMWVKGIARGNQSFVSLVKPLTDGQNPVKPFSIKILAILP